MIESRREHIRAARPEEAGALAALVNAAYRGDSGRQGWTTEADLLDGTRVSVATVAALLADPACVLMACEVDGELVGCMELRDDAGRLYLGMLTVAPGAQGRGIGGRLMDAAEAHARANDYSTLVMTVISVRHELIGWYARRGFRPTGETKPFGFPDESFGIPRQPLEFVVLEKDLGGPDALRRGRGPRAAAPARPPRRRRRRR
jgi:ribosomal protein S18 acetylase RimI-like enzyme